jgi:hypothetical protein
LTVQNAKHNLKLDCFVVYRRIWRPVAGVEN